MFKHKCEQEVERKAEKETWKKMDKKKCVLAVQTFICVKKKGRSKSVFHTMLTANG